MKILFLCSSIESGRDGVGDYVCRLSIELTNLGHECQIIALHDRHLEKSSSGNNFLPNYVEVPTLRLSSKLAWNVRVIEATKFADSFAADIISLQYVPFGYHDKGLPFKLARRLLNIGKNTNWHIMFHELWVGMNVEASLKLRIWGMVQRVMIKKMIFLLNPIVLTTHTHVYKIQLAQFYKEIIKTRLVSNVKVQKQKFINDISGKIEFVIFGSLHSINPLISFFQELQKWLLVNKRECKITFIGRNGYLSATCCKLLNSLDIDFEIMHEQSLEVISQVLSRGNIGISTTPFWQIEKSGTVAAMQEHSMPVICVAEPWNPRGIKLISESIGVWEYQEGELHLTLCDIFNLDISKICSTNISEAAKKFLDSIAITSSYKH